MPHSSRRALAAAALVGPAALLTLTAPAARADTVDVDYQCKTPIGEKGAVSPIAITSKRSGETYQLTMAFEKGVSSSPVELGKGAMKPSALIALGGAASGTVAVSGPANTEAIPANTPIKISDLTGAYTPKKSGKVTFTASTLTIKALGTTTTCRPKNTPKPSLTLDVRGPGGSTATGGSGASGGAGGSGGSGGSGASGSSGGAGDDAGTLPQTGPADSAIALGTLGGTVLLTGVAGTLWLTRRRAPS